MELYDPFQFTRARGARRGCRRWWKSWGSFNSRAHGARDRPAPHQPEVPVVSIHARTGRATGPTSRTSSSSTFQFTRARGARLNTARTQRRTKHVSIHARTGRATHSRASSHDRSAFQFTRARGARLLGLYARCVLHWFQFTRARGARPMPSSSASSRTVSIHARTGRATFHFHPHEDMAMFQFTRARGARRASLMTIWRESVFQFTRARGARRGWVTVRAPSYVSIHARTGRATARGGLTPPAESFQFTRARGARQGGDTKWKLTWCFNSRAHGARDYPTTPPTAVRGSGFNSRAHGARDLNARLSNEATMFQFTRARGARRADSDGTDQGLGFNSRAHGARDQQPQ